MTITHVIGIITFIPFFVLIIDHIYIFIICIKLILSNTRYLSIVQEEGLEISQPGLDPVKSELHHPITVRRRRSRVHRLV